MTLDDIEKEDVRLLMAFKSKTKCKDVSFKPMCFSLNEDGKPKYPECFDFDKTYKTLKEASDRIDEISDNKDDFIIISLGKEVKE